SPRLRGRAPRQNGWQPRSPPSSLLPSLGPRLLRVQLVCLHDSLDELVPDDVFMPEADERDAVDGAEDVLYLDEPGGLLTRQVDLGDVAGDDDLGTEPEAGQEHLHLLRTSVLRFVENDERVVE